MLNHQKNADRFYFQQNPKSLRQHHHKRLKYLKIESSEEIEFYQGVPQGTVLKPLFFTIYVNDMRQSTAPYCQSLQYADDTMLYTTNEAFKIARPDFEKSFLKYQNISESIN